MIEQELRRIIRQIVREELKRIIQEELEKTRFITVDSARELITELAEELLPGIVAESLEDTKANRDVIPPPLPTIDQTSELKTAIDQLGRRNRLIRRIASRKISSALDN